jgi:hypothetical protein
MAQFKYTPPEGDNEDRVYVRGDDIFDIGILRVEAGIVIDVDHEDEFDFLGRLAVDEPSLTRTGE